jgi:hypothetical protein
MPQRNIGSWARSTPLPNVRDYPSRTQGKHTPAVLTCGKPGENRAILILMMGSGKGSGESPFPNSPESQDRFPLPHRCSPRTRVRSDEIKRLGQIGTYPYRWDITR